MRHHRRHHRLGDAAADRDLLVGDDRHAVAARELAGDRLAQRPRAPGDRVLVDVGLDRRAGRVLDDRGRREVGEPLRQVDAAVQLVQPRHLADDRLGELRRLLRTGELGHRTVSSGGATALRGRRPSAPACAAHVFLGGALAGRRPPSPAAADTTGADGFALRLDPAPRASGRRRGGGNRRRCRGSSSRRSGFPDTECRRRTPRRRGRAARACQRRTARSPAL